MDALDRSKALAARIAQAYSLAQRTPPDPTELARIAMDMADNTADIPDRWLLPSYDHARTRYNEIPSVRMVNKAWTDAVQAQAAEQARSLKVGQRRKHGCPWCMVLAWRMSEWLFEHRGINRSIPEEILDPWELRMIRQMPDKPGPREIDCLRAQLKERDPQTRRMLADRWRDTPFSIAFYEDPKQ